MIRNKRFLFGKMKSCCRFISNCRNLSIFASQFSNYKLNLGGYRKIDSYPFRILGFPVVIQLTHRISCWKETNFRQFDVHCRVRLGRDDFRVRCVVCDERIFSTTSWSGVDDKRFEKGCVQAGVNVKPLLVAKDGNEENVERQLGDVVEVNDGGVEKGVKIEVLDVAEVDTGNKKEAFVNDKRFNKGYIQGGVNIKPSVASKNGIEENEGAEVANANEKERECGKKAWRLIRNVIVTYHNNPIGRVAANDPDDTHPLNYDQVFIRDFVPSALAFLMKGEGEIVKNFLLHTLELQEREDVQTGIRLILNVCLSDGFDMFPTLLVTDGSCMFDRRIGTHGHPLEIQALFYSALRCSREILAENEGSNDVIKAINNRLSALLFHIREYYWVDMRKINEIYRYKTEEYSIDAINKFNIYPDQIPHWLMDWIPREGGYMLGNLQPAHMDFRFFMLGNLWGVISSLGTPTQNEAVLNLIEARWDDLIGEMPLKICFPAVENEDWRIITGCDPKNTPWSYHNGGSWPTLLWQFTLVCIKMGRTDLAKKAIQIAEERLEIDRWPEYYDTRYGKFVGKQARLYQTWTIAALETSKMFLENPKMASMLYWDEDNELLELCICTQSETSRKKCARGSVKSQALE